MSLFYSDDWEYAVELFDRVEIRRDGEAFEGTVTKIHPRSSEVTVRYKDHLCPRRGGEPAARSCRSHISATDLIARDG